MKIKLYCALFLIFSSRVFSQSVQYRNCDSLNTQFEMNQCCVENYELSKIALEETWQKILATLNRRKSDVQQEVQKYETGNDSITTLKNEEELVRSILDSQEKWITYMESICHIEAVIYNGGSMLPMQVATCKLSIILKRIEDLEGLLEELNR